MIYYCRCRSFMAAKMSGLLSLPCLVLYLRFVLAATSVPRDLPECLSTLSDFQHSLVDRTLNLDSLNLAFSPSNHQPSISFVVYYHFCTRTKYLNETGSLVLCDNIEKWANDISMQDVSQLLTIPAIIVTSSCGMLLRLSIPNSWLLCPYSPSKQMSMPLT